MRQYYYFKRIAIAAFMFIGALAMTSCDDDSTGTTRRAIDPTVDTHPTQSEALSANAQKAKLQEVGTTLLREIDANDFKPIVDEYLELRNDLSANDASEIFNKLSEFMSLVIQDDEQYAAKGMLTAVLKKGYPEALWDFSQFTGHFTLDRAKKQWVMEKANDLRFVYPDPKGNTLVLSVVLKGKKTPVHIGPIYLRRFNIPFDNTLVVPEDVKATLTLNGRTLIELEIETDLSLATANPNFTTDKLSFEAELTVGNYKVELDRLSYAPGAGINVELELKKNGKDLVTMKATQAGTITESYDKLNEGNIFIDLLGKVQVAGHTNNTSELIQTFLPSAAKAINEAETNEAEIKQIANKFNENLDLKLYYNYDPTEQAKLTMEAYDSEGWWSIRPMINFYDGSKAVTLQQFFNPSDYSNLLAGVESLIENFRALFDTGEKVYVPDEDYIR
jgi:hypothetical protein